MGYDERRDDLLFQSAKSDGAGGFVPAVARDMAPTLADYRSPYHCKTMDGVTWPPAEPKREESEGL